MITNCKEYLESEYALFHYTKTKILLENIFSENQLKLSLLSETNDPLEYTDYLFDIGWFVTNDPKLLSSDSPAMKAKGLINSIIRNQTRILFLCANSMKRCGWNKSRMWSQYGDNHFGICIVLSKRKLESYLKQIRTKTHSDYIDYQNKIDFNQASMINPNEIVNNDVKDYAYNHVFTHIKEFYFTKNTDYEDESEYRCIIYDEKNQYSFIKFDKIAEGIILGDRTPGIYNKLIKSKCKEYNIFCRKLRFSKAKMHLLEKF